jgi:hypothetical protein
MYYGRMTTTTKKAQPKDAGYQVVRISKRAYRKVMDQAVKERRTFVAQADVMLGV